MLIHRDTSHKPHSKYDSEGSNTRRPSPRTTSQDLLTLLVQFGFALRLCLFQRLVTYVSQPGALGTVRSYGRPCVECTYPALVFHDLITLSLQAFPRPF